MTHAYLALHALLLGYAQIVLIVGVLAATVAVNIVDGKLQDGLRAHYVLDSPDAGSYAEWVDSDTPGAPLIYTTFTVYSIANPWDVVMHGAKPRLIEVGPLRYV